MYPLFQDSRFRCLYKGAPLKVITDSSLFPNFQKCQFSRNSEKIKKNSSQNDKSRIPIRDSKFLASLFTPSGTFIFEKNHILEIPFL